MVVRSRSCVGLKGCAVLRDCCVRTHIRLGITGYVGLQLG